MAQISDMMISRSTVFLVSMYLLSIITGSDVGYYTDSLSSCPKETEYNLNSTSGRAYRNNVESLLSELSSKASNPNGFYNFTSATAYGLFYCYGGEATPSQCQTCVETLTSVILRDCPNTTWAVVYGRLCMLRFSNESIFSRLDTNPDATHVLYATSPVSNMTLFNRVLSEAFDAIVPEAANGGVSGRKYAFRESNYTLFQNKVYSLGQCTPDLTSLDCKYCLAQAVQKLSLCCTKQAGGAVLCPSCRIRYETFPFFQTPPPPLPPQQPPQQPTPVPGPSSNQGNQGISTTTLAVIILPIVIIIVALVAIFICKATRAKRRKTPFLFGMSSERNIISTDRESLRYRFSEIQSFTNNFADENIIGRGGFGPVYKGSLPNGELVAVKRLSRGSTQGGEQFVNEISLVAKLQHRNLVRLLGYCLEREEKILIYEFVINKSLDYFLFDPEKQPLLNWLTRYKIIGGIARGLLYLHEDSRVNIIHRDLKPGNVLLDEKMNTKIADFGLATLFEIDQSMGNISKIAGTYGYMAPEYALHGKLSVKSYVFSFGVLVLEIISGKKISNTESFADDDNLLTYAWKKLREGYPLEMMDPAIGDSYERNEVIRCIHIGLLCVQDDVERRPTMASVILMFNNNSITLSTPNRPPYSDQRSIPTEISVDYSDKLSSDRIKNCTNELSITELCPR